MKKPAQAILKTIIDDIASSNPAVLDLAVSILNNGTQVNLLLMAGCPPEVIDALKETCGLSYAERKYCCGEIGKAIKKIPAD